MERVISLSLLAVLLMPAHVSRAGTILAPRPSDAAENQDGRYAESRFGQAPAKVDLGVGPSYVKHAVSELDPIRDEEGWGGSEPTTRRAGQRKPAGLEFSENGRAVEADPTVPKKTVARPESIRPETGLPEPAPNTISRSGVQEVAVIASDLGYFPRTLFVTRDLPVRLFVTGASKNTLCIMMDSFQVRKQVRSQKIEEITFTPNVPGKYRFYCPVNGMEGTLIVKEYSTGIETAWASSTNQ
jgi:hypothetical protein